jgi:hypothetical protein
MVEVRVRGVSDLFEIEGTLHILVVTSLCVANNCYEALLVFLSPSGLIRV